ncbi:MAG TPA: NAD(P)-binding domain-containing protein, partial [Myxococcota bacterium]
MNRLEELKARIASRDAHIGVIGLGYVGLPLALEFTRAGHGVTGFDVDQERVQLLTGGTSYIE